MSMRAIANVYDYPDGWKPIAVAASKTGLAIDLANVIENVFVFKFGLWTDGTHTGSLTYSGTPGGAGTYTACAAADLVGSTLAAVTSTATAAVEQYASYIGPYQYIKMVQTVAAATVGAVSAAFAVVKKRRQP